MTRADRWPAGAPRCRVTVGLAFVTALALAAGWLVSTLEFGLFGLLARAWPTAMEPLSRFAYPFSIAWHGPIIPYMVLGAGALVWLPVPAEQAAMLRFWRDPADPVHARLLREAGIAYVLVPEAVGDPASRHRAWRGLPPALLPGTRSSPADAPHLRLAYEAGGAAVYAVAPAGAGTKRP